MSLAAFELPSELIAAYSKHPALAPYDELLNGSVPHGHTARLAQNINDIGMAGLLAAKAEAVQLADEEGMVFGAGAAKDTRLWNIDPLPVILDGWDALERGLAQRARLLRLLLTDVYSSQHVLKEGLIPPAAVLSNAGYLRSAFTPGAPAPALRVTAADLGRAADGTWHVIADLNQAPAGAGYAMANRRVVSQVLSALHRASDLRRLRGFYQQLAATLLDVGTMASETPRVVLLTPGTRSDTEFDQGYLASLLGFSLAEADDLVVRDGRVWLRAGGKYEQVDVILRRVDALDADPLDIRGDSTVGVPGLAECAQNGRVALANSLGTGVLNSPALLPYLPGIARTLLGEDLQIPMPESWWCFEQASRSHVLANLPRLLIRQIHGTATVDYLGWELTGSELEGLRKRILAHPEMWCGMVPLPLSSAPVVTRRGLEPRRFLLRTFGILDGEGFKFLPGGLGRVGESSAKTVGSLGALAKDVWVPAGKTSAQAPTTSLRPIVHLTQPAVALAPRVAGTLMAIGRFAERAEGKARLIKVADNVAADHLAHLGTAGYEALKVLLASVHQILGAPAYLEESEPEYLHRVTLDSSLPGSVSYEVLRLFANSQQVRDLMSVDTWSVFARLRRTLTQAGADAELQPLLEDGLESLMAYAGIVAQSMVRDASWAFLDAGGRLERARFTLLLLEYTQDCQGAGAELVAESVLRICESIITHRRRAATGLGPVEARESVLRLLLEDRANPRSVAFQLHALAFDLTLAGDAIMAKRAGQIADGLADHPQTDIPTWLAQQYRQLVTLGEDIAKRHFSRQVTRHTAEPLQGNLRGTGK
ncbi:MAG: circularly permuted type 2 ATP-grasp protein [Propionibacteriaceae bacterium]|jgi:uncharacterized circularly permuted ATP-grasp superfamily protein/uncharacterized alpha-E superfamily protein|nr:circularly permuted type 2 ATP-grasp protein [Propionibacteriaceae bacterium]